MNTIFFILLQLSGSRGITGKKQSKLEAHSGTIDYLTCAAKWIGHNNIEITGSVYTIIITTSVRS